jgi:superfamily II DNA/RNA helicase
MSSIKRHYHRIHPCTSQRKAELLKHLLEINETSSILIVTAYKTEDIESLVDNRDIIVTDDASLADFPDLMRELVISYDLPLNAQDYAKRILHAETRALILLDENDQSNLYEVETLLGRTLMQEVISGFEIQESTKPKPTQKRERDKKTYSDRKKPFREKRESFSKPKRTSKRVSIKSIKPKESSE